MTKYEKENLLKLSKEQLIKIIEDETRKLFRIDCVLVDHSKCHIDSDKAIDKILNYVTEYPQYSFYEENLGDYIDLQLGKISGGEYRKRTIGQDNDVCDECYDCKWFWANVDTGNECNGSKTKCHEYIGWNRN